jgi:hypothetical protein
MKMPETIAPSLLSVCGMNCLVCYKHCAAKSVKHQCPGCLSNNLDKPKHCRICKIKACADGKGNKRCLECEAFPCTLIKNLEKSYNKRYAESLVANSVYVRENGIEAFMELEKQNRICVDCGGVVSLHDKVCSDCQRDYAPGKAGKE